MATLGRINFGSHLAQLADNPVAYLCGQDPVCKVIGSQEAVAIAKEVQSKSKKLKDFKEVLESDSDVNNKCDDLRARVNEYASKYSMPGHDDH